MIFRKERGKTMKIRRILLLLFVSFALTSTASAAITYTFSGITNNDPGDTAIGEAQLTMELSDPGGGQALFTFYNDGPEQSTISEIYFDDGTLLSLAGIVESSGVDFSVGGSPPVLPGGNALDPDFETSFMVSADNPAPTNGVDPGESVGLLFNLQGGQTFANVIGAISNGDLRIGLHVINFESGGSESFVLVPAPGALILGSLGTLAVAASRTIRNKKRY